MHFLLSLVTAGLVSADVFSINAFIPGSSIDGSLLHASHHGLYSGLTEPATYCPLNPPSDCPQVAGTLVTQNMGAMAVAVAGGQQIYIQADGQVKYSIPHSAYIPPGSIRSGWYHKTVTSPARVPMQYDLLDFDDGRGHSGLALCPDTNFSEGGIHALYAKTEGFNTDLCIDVAGLILTKSESTVGCWQYE
ncbi:hypothetical protein F4825DRAFT_474644 [Nemania diffusa]|nr:hypothetical protein F4825DRAFT_474644 [Nemania diffusa]